MHHNTAMATTLSFFPFHEERKPRINYPCSTNAPIIPHSVHTPRREMHMPGPETWKEILLCIVSSSICYLSEQTWFEQFSGDIIIKAQPRALVTGGKGRKPCSHGNKLVLSRSSLQIHKDGRTWKKRRKRMRRVGMCEDMRQRLHKQIPSGRGEISFTSHLDH